MKVKKNYVLVINPVLRTAIYGKSATNEQLASPFNLIIDCTLSQLKYNLKWIEKRGMYHIMKEYRNKKKKKTLWFF